MVATNFSASLMTFSALVFSPHASHCSSVKAERNAARSLPVSAGREPSVLTAIESATFLTAAGFFAATGCFAATGAAGFLDFDVAMCASPSWD